MNNAVSAYVMQAGAMAYPHVNSVEFIRHWAQVWFQLRFQPRVGVL